MQIKEEKAIKWYNDRGLSSDSWDSFSELVKGMVCIEAIAEEWDEVDQLLETGIPEQAVLIYFNIEKIGLKLSEMEERDSTDSYESLTTYSLQNTTSENLESLLIDNEVTIESVALEKDCLRVECSAKGSDILL